MKRVKSLIFILFILSSAVFSQTTSHTHEELESFRENLINHFNMVSKWDDQTWTKKLTQFAEIYRAAGKNEKADHLEALSDAATRNEVLEIIKEKIDDNSENGWWAFIIISVMYIDRICLNPDPNAEFREWETIIMLFLVIALGEEGSASEI